jgi:hypothetical protein
MLSVYMGLGPPIDIKVPLTCHSERGICFFFTATADSSSLQLHKSWFNCGSFPYERQNVNLVHVFVATF